MASTFFKHGVGRGGTFDPLWFWFENFFIDLQNRKKGAPAPTDIDLFKYGKDVSSKMWLAVVYRTFGAAF